MKVYRISLPDSKIAPFQDLVSETPILNQKLSTIQDSYLMEAGLEIVSVIPTDEPFLLISERIWFTAELIRRFIAMCQSQKCYGRMIMRHEQWDEHMSPLQDNQDGYDIAWIESKKDLQDVNHPSFAQLPSVEMDWELEQVDGFELHITMQHASRDLWGSPCVAHHICHWSHILRVNQLAIGNQFQISKLEYAQAGFLGKLKIILRWILKIRSFNKRKILQRIGNIGTNCQIHSTAVIEGCDIGDDVVIGPYSVLRGSVIGSGSKIEEHSTINISVVGENCQIGRYATANLCLLYPESLISHGGGLQGCVFGRRSFGAIGVQILDLSFGKNVFVEHKGEWVDSGQMFLGGAVGHRAVIGNAIRINYGVSIPNDTILVASTDDLVRDANSYIDHQKYPKKIYQLRQGKLIPLGRSKESD
jgi:carbonic anhydrase/acetyltransferase-like protein (isoleucine patch superfamily)